MVIGAIGEASIRMKESRTDLRLWTEDPRMRAPHEQI